MNTFMIFCLKSQNYDAPKNQSCPPPPSCQLDVSSKKFNLRLKIQLDSNCVLFFVPLLNHILFFFISLVNVDNMPTLLIFCSISRYYAQKNQSFTFMCQNYHTISSKIHSMIFVQNTRTLSRKIKK